MLESSDLLENIHKIIIFKIATLKNIASIFELNETILNLEYIYNKYILSIMDILLKYYDNYDNENVQIECNTQYKYRINSIYILNKIDIVYNNINNYIKHNNIVNEDVQIKIFNYNNIVINHNKFSSSTNNFCSCLSHNNYITINYNEIICKMCGKIYKDNNNMKLVLNDDKQIPKYDFLRHYRIWLDKILATNTKDLKKYSKEIDLLKKKIDLDYPNDQQKKHLGIPHIRTYLKNTNLTFLNDMIPIILKEITKNEPPILTTTEYNDLELLFIQVMKVYDTIKNNNEINRKYYPYFIYKIIEYYFRNNHSMLKLLNNIHLQKRKTLVSNDLKWKEICHKMNPRILYKETLYNIYE